MRSGMVEGLAVVIGVLLVVTWYLERQAVPPAPVVAEMPAVPPALTAPPAVLPDALPSPASSAAAPVAEPVIETARAAWEEARAELATVRSDLERLDERFDEKDAELARLEEEGADPDEIEEQMLIFLDAVVTQYEELEGRLATAEAAEHAAADRLQALRGDRS
ncbi:MAG TPA: hypothetical protein VIS76_08985 [Pseudomonadales bacterium]